MAKDETKKRINFILDLNKPREKALADFLDSQFSISGTVKEALEEKMLRTTGNIIDVVAPAVKETVEETPVIELDGIDGLMDI